MRALGKECLGAAGSDARPVVTFTETQSPGSTPQIYKLVRIWTATDASGNHASASQTLTVQQTTRPVFEGYSQLVTLRDTGVCFSRDALLRTGSDSSANDTLVLARLEKRTLNLGCILTTADGSVWYRPPTSGFSGADVYYYAVSNELGAVLSRTGMVQVLTSPVAPTVKITEPSVRTLISMRADVPLTAAVDDADGVVMRVEFYANRTLVAVTTNRVGNSFSGLWSGAGAGSCLLSATAYTSDGRIIGSPASNLSLVLLPNVQTQGRAFVIEASPDLVNWTVVKSFVNGGSAQENAPGAFNFEDNSSGPMHFYRARAL